jgi:hypothetical protein
MPEKYGETSGECEAREMLRCRQIVSEITQFGVSQREMLRIIHLLSLELEDREAMVDLSERTRSAINRSAGSLDSLIVET